MRASQGCQVYHNIVLTYTIDKLVLNLRLLWYFQQDGDPPNFSQPARIQVFMAMKTELMVHHDSLGRCTV